MMRQILVLLTIASLAGTAAAEPDPHDDSVASIKAAFPALNYLQVDGAVIAYANGTTLINKRRADLPAAHPLHVTGDLSEDDILLMETNLAAGQRAFVLFSLGPSADP